MKHIISWAATVSIVDVNNFESFAKDLEDEYGDHQDQVLISPSFDEIAAIIPNRIDKSDPETEPKIVLYQCESLNYVPNKDDDADYNLSIINASGNNNHDYYRKSHVERVKEIIMENSLKTLWVDIMDLLNLNGYNNP